MNIPWPQPFDDGDVQEFLLDFEDVAELVGVKTEQAKLVCLRSLSRGRAKAVLDAARAANGKLEWSAAKEALLAGFSGPADRHAAMQRFKNASLTTGSDPLVFTVHLRKELRKALPSLEKSSAEVILIDKFLDAMPAKMAKQLKLAALVRQMTLEEMAEAVRSLSSEQKQVASLERLDNGTELRTLQHVVERLTQEVPNPGDKRRAAHPTPEAGYGKDIPVYTVSSVSTADLHTDDPCDEEYEQQQEPEEEQEAKEEEEEQEEKGAQFYPGKEAEETQSLKIQEDFRPQKEAKEPGTRRKQEHTMSFEARRNWANQKRKKLYQLNHAILPSQEFGKLVQKRIRFWKIYRGRKKKRKRRKKFKGGRSVVCGLISPSNQWKGVVDQ
ncbi:unnamed protein product [Calicophoron daubneyi]|uniref:Uncharacterized protein n=1 Tax=Calicophoron daubneyi TaxID=300641 RepID=A0AAV2TUJ9_CALDB